VKHAIIRAPGSGTGRVAANAKAVRRPRRRPTSRAMQRGGMRGGRAGWHQPGFRFRYRPRDPTRIVSFFTMSNSVVFFLPAARCSPRVHSSSFVSRPLRVVLHPNEGRRSAGAGHWQFVALARRDDSPPGRREGASRRSTWRFSAVGPTLRVPAVPTGIRAATSPTAKHWRPADRVPASRGCGSRPPPRDATPRSALRAPPAASLVSEDERITIMSSTCSQLRKRSIT
jgi:hypothetical protein